MCKRKQPPLRPRLPRCPLPSRLDPAPHAHPGPPPPCPLPQPQPKKPRESIKVKLQKLTARLVKRKKE